MSNAQKRQIVNKNLIVSEKKQRKTKGHDDSASIRRGLKATFKAAAQTNGNSTAKTSTEASPKTRVKVTPQKTIKTTPKKSIKSSPRTPVKPTRQTPSKTTGPTKPKPKTPATSVKKTKKGSDKTSTNSSDKSSSNTLAKGAPKRKANELASPGPSDCKKGRTNCMTPRRHLGQAGKRKSTKKDKNSPIQFDYGVPSPTETERDSVEDEDSPSQLLAKAAQRVVVAVTKQNQTVRVSLDPPKAFIFKSEQARKLWETATKERAELVKGVIESTDFVPDWLKRQLEGSLELSAAQKRTIVTEDKNRRTQGMLGWLKLEEKALDLDAEIKLSLKKEFTNTDVDKCIACIDKLLNLPVDPLTLKKYPHLGMTPCSLQRYKGALTQWSLSSQQEETFCSKRAIIWKKAEVLQQKYMSVFGIDDPEKYVESFKQRVQSFQDSVSHLSEEEVSLLVHDPLSKKIVKKKVSLA